MSLHAARTGITESAKMATLCEANGVPALIGTDLEAATGALAALHLRAVAVPDGPGFGATLDETALRRYAA